MAVDEVVASVMGKVNEVQGKMDEVKGKVSCSSHQDYIFETIPVQVNSVIPVGGGAKEE